MTDTHGNTKKKRRTPEELAAHHAKQSERHAEKALMARFPEFAEIMKIRDTYLRWWDDRPCVHEFGNPVVEALDALVADVKRRASEDVDP